MTLLETVTPEDLGVSGEIREIAAYREGQFVALVREEDHDAIVIWRGEYRPERLPPIPAPEQSSASHLIVDVRSRNVAFTLGTALRATSHNIADDDSWLWHEPSAEEPPLIPLILLEDMILVGVGEADHDGGEGGASNSAPARLEWRSKDGHVLESLPAQGNPTTALDLGGTVDDLNEGFGFLIGETNSFWGSYQAALEVYGEAGELTPIAQVPVRSSIDGTDGAFDLAILGDRLFVANCESGLLTGAWPEDPWNTPRIGLRPLPGPWQPSGTGRCAPTGLEAIDDVLVVAGENVVFARLCGSVPVCLAAPSAEVVSRELPISREDCQSLGGIPTARNGGVTGCPFGTPSLGMLEAPEAGECCRPTPELSRAQCAARGGEASSETGGKELQLDGCSYGRRFLGRLTDASDELAICCEQLPALSADKCGELGGEGADVSSTESDDSGSSDPPTIPARVDLDGCPGGRRALGFITKTSEPVLCCELPKPLSHEECLAQCGDVLWSSAPENEGVLRDGCPGRRQWLGTLENENQDGICCALP